MWISLVEYLPDSDADVWCYSESLGVRLGEYSIEFDRFFDQDSFPLEPVDYWQPAIIPQPPEE